MTIELELQIASDAQTLPHPSQFREWVAAALEDRIDETEMTIRIVDEEEMTELNQQYRKKNGPTNVLSFPADDDSEFGLSSLGDIVICAPIVAKQADQQNKALIAYWAHMVIHGTLHLLNYDHQTEEEAQEMESLETNILVSLGYPPPYAKGEQK